MKKIYGLLLLAAGALPASAQYINNAGGIDQEWYNFGFSLALNYGSFNVIKRADYQEVYEPLADVNGDEETVAPFGTIRSIGKPGFSLGLLANLKLNRHFDLRFTPNIIFVDRDIEYVYREEVSPGASAEPDLPGSEPLPVPETARLNIRFTNMQYPLLLKFKSKRQGNVRAYVIGGAKYSMDVTSRKKYNEAKENARKFPADPENPLFVDRGYFAWEAGIGVDLYYEFFKCSPELKISRSFNSVLYRDENLYSRPLAGLFTELVQFTVHFE